MKTIINISIVALTLIINAIPAQAGAANWKRACRRVEINVTRNCVIDSQNWVRQAKKLGFKNVGVVSYWVDGNVRKPHQICYVGTPEARIFIEPQYGWKVKLNSKELDGLHYSGNDSDA